MEFFWLFKCESKIGWQYQHHIRQMDWLHRTMQWPAQCPDLTPLEFLWSYIKNAVYQNRPPNIDEGYKNRIFFLQNCLLLLRYSFKYTSKRLKKLLSDKKIALFWNFQVFYSFVGFECRSENSKNGAFSVGSESFTLPHSLDGMIDNF